MTAYCQELPSGIVVRVTRPLSAEEVTALDAYLRGLADAARAREETRRAALSPLERAAEDERVRAAAERSQARVARLRGQA